MIRWTLRNSALRVAVSTALKHKMAEVGGADIPIHVIPNGVDATRFYPIPREDARRQLEIEPARRVIVAVGSLIEQKGHQVLIRAMADIVRRHSDVHLYILGHGPYRKALEELIETLGLNGQIHLVGKRPNEELKLWFSVADVSCLVSEREGWPNVVTESLACGTPVVATRVGGIPEIIDRPQFGILVDPTPESVATGLEEALSRKWDREAISREVLVRTWDTVAQEVEDLFASQLRPCVAAKDKT
jgi:glycosyltransferase involved in cell wall biosynthesis